MWWKGLTVGESRPPALSSPLISWSFWSWLCLGSILGFLSCRGETSLLTLLSHLWNMKHPLIDSDFRVDSSSGIKICRISPLSLTPVCNFSLWLPILLLETYTRQACWWNKPQNNNLNSFPGNMKRHCIEFWIWKQLPIHFILKSFLLYTYFPYVPAFLFTFFY